VPADETPAVDDAAVAALLLEFGQRTALRGNPYPAKAYRRAAENLSALTLPLSQIIREGRLQEILGSAPLSPI